MFGIFGLGHSNGSDISTIMRQLNIEQKLQISYYNSSIMLGTYDNSQIEESQIAWKDAAYANWSINATDTLALTYKDIVVTQKVYDQLIKPLTTHHNCKTYTQIIKCANITESIISKVPPYTISIDQLKITLHVNDLIANYTATDKLTNDEQSYDIIINVAIDDYIGIPLEWVQSQYIIIMDYESRIIGLARVKTNWCELTKVGVGILVVLMVVVYYCEKKPKLRDQ